MYGPPESFARASLIDPRQEVAREDQCPPIRGGEVHTENLHRRALVEHGGQVNRTPRGKTRSTRAAVALTLDWLTAESPKLVSERDRRGHRRK